MYNDNIRLVDIYNVIDGVRDDLGTVCSNQNELANKIQSVDDSIGEVDKTISREMGYIAEILSNLLNETRKTNILLKKSIKSNGVTNAVKFDSKKHSNRSLVIINDSFLKAKEYAQILADTATKKLEIIDMDNGGSIASKLTNANVNDYVLVNCNTLSDDGKDMIINAMQDNVIKYIIGTTDRKEMKLDLKPINYIIYSDMIELLDPRLIEGLDIVE